MFKNQFIIQYFNLNPVYEKIYIITKQKEEKYNFLSNKYPNDIRIFYQNDEYDLDELIDGKKQVCCIFHDLIKDNN